MFPLSIFLRSISIFFESIQIGTKRRDLNMMPAIGFDLKKLFPECANQFLRFHNSNRSIRQLFA